MLCTVPAFPRSCYEACGLCLRNARRVNPHGNEASKLDRLFAYGEIKGASTVAIQMNFLESMECLLVSELPEGPEWAYDIKLDGYRAQALAPAEPQSFSRAMAKTSV
jgi:ATP-dependent DNA ligase